MRLILAIAILALFAGPADAGELLTSADRKTYRAAFDKARHSDFKAAFTLAARASEPLPAKVLQWLKLKHPRRSNDFTATIEFIEANPLWPGRRALRRVAEKTMPADLPDLAVLAWFSAHPPLTPEGTVRYGRALLATGRTSEATALLRAAWIDLDMPRSLERAYRKEFDAQLSRDDDLARLERLLWDRRRTPALRHARRLGPDYQALALARLKLAYREPGVDPAIAKVPDELRGHPGLVFERARWRLRKGRYEDTIALLDPAPDGIVEPARWWRLRRAAARRALSEGDISVAYRLTSGNGLDNGAGFAEGEFLAGWIALRFLEEPTRAYEHFERLYKGVALPISRARGAFWAGEAARALDKSDWAQQWYRLAAVHDETFYGQLATLRLGARQARITAPATRPDKAQAKAFEARELVRIVRLLAELDQDELVKDFFAALRVGAESESEFRLIGDLALSLGRIDQAIHTAKSARRQGIHLPAHLFPDSPFLSVEQPDDALLAALIRQESGFDPTAISHAGARGLMQMMPATAKATAKRLRLKFDRLRLTSDPDYNLRLGRAFLADLIKRYDGYLPLVLAAYNAGPRRANIWIREHGDPRQGDIDAVDWIEMIPFSETRNYVQRVLEGLTIYRQRLDHESQPLAMLLQPPQVSQRPDPTPATTD